MNLEGFRREGNHTIIIGAGSGGLSAAAGAAMLGLKVVLFEQGEMGGDCLNSGCVPSKALISAVWHFAIAATRKEFGSKFQKGTCFAIFSKDSPK